MTDHLLSVVIFLPLVGVAALLLSGPRVSDTASRWIALVTTLATFGVALVIWSRFAEGQAGFQMVEQASWVPSVGLQYLVGIDGISLWMVMLTTFLFPVSALAAWTITTNVRR